MFEGSPCVLLRMPRARGCLTRLIGDAHLSHPLAVCVCVILQWRIYTIFGNRRLKTVVLTDRAMLARLGVFIALEIILRCVEVGITPIRMVAKQIGNCAPTQSLQDLLEGTAGSAVVGGQCDCHS